MSGIVRYEFMGSWLLFWFACITGFGIPLAILYLINSAVRIDEEVSDPARFLEEFQARS